MGKLKNIFKDLFSKKKRQKHLAFFLTVFLYLLVQLRIKTGNISSLIKGLLIPLCSYIVTALALNVVVGISGELSLGQAGFMSVGAFSGAVASAWLAQYTDSKVLILTVAMIIGFIMAGIFGFIIGIPVLKLEGDYLAIVTLAFGQIVKTLVSNLYVGLDEAGLHFSFVEDTTGTLPTGRMIINGPSGLSGNMRISTFTAGFVLIMIALFVIYRLLESKQGRAIMACRDNRIAASSVGISVSKYKLMAFVLSSALAGAAGVLYIMSFASAVPTKFDYNLSILLLVYVVLGGLGNMPGTIIATVSLLLIPEMLRSLQDYRMLIYPVILIVIMLVTNNPLLKNKLAEIRKLLFRKGVKND